MNKAFFGDQDEKDGSNSSDKFGDSSINGSCRSTKSKSITIEAIPVITESTTSGDIIESTNNLTETSPNPNIIESEISVTNPNKVEGISGSPELLSSVEDDFPSSVGFGDEDSTSSLDQEESTTPMGTIVTRGSLGIFKPNQRYALVTSTEILVPRSAKYALMERSHSSK